VYACSDNNKAALSIRVSSGHATLADVGRDESLVEGVCVWVVDIVIDTSVIVKASWLPEFLHVSIGVIVIKQEHRRVANQEEAEVVSLETCVKGLEV
jgi:hypothetical protein